MKSSWLSVRVTEAELKEIHRQNANENLSQKIRDFLLNGKAEPRKWDKHGSKIANL